MDDVPNPGCTRNFTINGYEMCIPYEWTVIHDPDGHLTIDDASGHETASVHCPLLEDTYPGLTITKRSRTYTRDGTTYGTDLWVGRQTGETNPSLLVLFVHLHDFQSWFGDNYADIDRSCQIKSLDPSFNEIVFRTMFISAY